MLSSLLQPVSFWNSLPSPAPAEDPDRRRWWMGTFVGFSWKRLLQVSGGETAQMAGNERREAAGGGISEASVGSLGV